MFRFPERVVKDDCLGTLVFRGHHFPVIRMEFVRGGIEVIARGVAINDQDKVCDEPVTIFGTDNMGVDQGGEFNMPGFHKGDLVKIKLFLSWEYGK